MSETKHSATDPRQGPLHPAAGDGVVIVKDPPNAAMHLTPDEADISGIRLLDAAERARATPPSKEPKAE